MQLNEIPPVYDAQKPFIRVYLEGRPPADDAQKQVRLRWDGLRSRLSEAGATDEALQALDAAVLDSESGEVHTNGRVLVAHASRVVHHEAWDDDSVHKPRGGALSHKQIQRLADEMVKQNIREVADHLDKVAKSWNPDLVVLAGEVQGRAALRDELSPALKDRFVEVGSGNTSDDGAEAALTDELRRLAAEHSDRAAEPEEQFGTAQAHGLAVEGADRVARATEMGAVETLLLEYDRTAERETELLAGCVRTDAEAALINASVDDAVAAVLRFEVHAQ